MVKILTVKLTREGRACLIIPYHISNLLKRMLRGDARQKMFNINKTSNLNDTTRPNRNLEIDFLNYFQYTYLCDCIHLFLFRHFPQFLKV